MSLLRCLLIVVVTGITQGYEVCSRHHTSILKFTVSSIGNSANRTQRHVMVKLLSEGPEVDPVLAVEHWTTQCGGVESVSMLITTNISNKLSLPDIIHPSRTAEPKVSCQLGYTQVDNLGCYKVYFGPVTWEQARRICEAENSNLAFPESKLEMDILRIFKIQYKLPRWPWIGIYKQLGEWRTLQDEQYGSSGFTGWKQGEPKGRGDCGYIDSHGSGDWKCSDTGPFICKELIHSHTATIPSKKSNCQSDYELMFGMTCYKVHKEHVSWKQAQLICKNENSILAFPETKLEYDTLVLFKIRDELSRWPWIGIHKTDGIWRTVEDQPFGSSGFTGWKPGEPQGRGNCGYLDGTGCGDWSCSDTGPFICMKRLE